jgi:hypothetical protein
MEVLRPARVVVVADIDAVEIKVPSTRGLIVIDPDGHLASIAGNHCAGEVKPPGPGFATGATAAAASPEATANAATTTAPTRQQSLMSAPLDADTRLASV